MLKSRKSMTFRNHLHGYRPFFYHSEKCIKSYTFNLRIFNAFIIHTFKQGEF